MALDEADEEDNVLQVPSPNRRCAALDMRVLDHPTFGRQEWTWLP
jgi:hypothetical protein